MKKLHFYFSEEAKRQRNYLRAKPITALIDGKHVEATHWQKKKTEGPVLSPDEKYLGCGVLSKAGK